MKIILISEHYDSFIGGTSTYVKSISNALASRGVTVDLIVPNQTDTQNLKIVSEGENLKVHYLGSFQILNSNYRNSRLKFAEQVNLYLNQVINNIAPDVLHVLVGMYLIEKLKIESFNIPACVTLHNVPPRECSKTWKGDFVVSYIVEKLRLNLVKAVNYRRIVRRKYDAYIPGSYKFGEVLSQILPDRNVTPIEDGFSTNLEAVSSLRATTSICRLLTVAGYIPHKGQHLVLEAATELRNRGLSFNWTMIGPIRLQKYYQYLQQQVTKLGLSEQINIKVEIPRKELEVAYASNDIYVQPSLEEGFCFTALEAAFYKLPVVGTNEGAIPEIIRRGQGILVEPHKESIVEAILTVWNEPSAYFYSEKQFIDLKNHYSWQRATDELINLYQTLK